MWCSAMPAQYAVSVLVLRGPCGALPCLLSMRCWLQYEPSSTPPLFPVRLGKGGGSLLHSVLVVGEGEGVLRQGHARHVSVGAARTIGLPSGAACPGSTLQQCAVYSGMACTSFTQCAVYSGMHQLHPVRRLQCAWYSGMACTSFTLCVPLNRRKHWRPALL